MDALLLPLPPSPSSLLGACEFSSEARCRAPSSFPTSSSSSSSSSSYCASLFTSAPSLHSSLKTSSSFTVLTSTSSSALSKPHHRFPLLSFHCCSFNGPSVPQWDEDDSKYLEAQVVEAVSLLPSQGHLFMTLANGGEVEIDHINPPKGRLLYRSRNPTIFLKILCETDLLLPIIVGDVAIGMLMKALHGQENTMRPSQYHLMRNLVGALKFEVRMVRVTERVADTYLARIYVGKPGEEEMQSVDARPSDAVNLAVRCKVPIYVNKDIVYSDAVRPIYAAPHTTFDMGNPSVNRSSLDRPENGRDPFAEELTLMKNMLLAVVDERYDDAARWRDELHSLRARRRRIRQL